MRETQGPGRSFPYPYHRTMDQVLRDEAEGCFCELVEEYGDRDDCEMVLRLAVDEA